MKSLIRYHYRDGVTGLELSKRGIIERPRELAILKNLTVPSNFFPDRSDKVEWTWQ